MSGESAIGDISINGGTPSEVYSDFLNVSPGWTETMRIPLLGGRDFVASDVNPAVAIVNQSFAKQYFDGENPIGKWFERAGPGDARSRIQVVGFVGDARSRDDMRRPIRPTAYVPFQSYVPSQSIDAKGAFLPMSRGTFVVRTSSANPLALASILRREVPNARAEIRVSNIRTQTEIDQAHTVRERLLAMLGVFFRGHRRPAAGRGGAVRRIGIFRFAAAEGDRHSHRDWRAGRGGIARLVAVDVLSMVAAGCAGGAGAWPCSGAIHGIAVLPGEGHRPGDAGDSHIDHCGGGVASRDAGGDPRGATGSGDDASFGIGAVAMPIAYALPVPVAHALLRAAFTLVVNAILAAGKRRGPMSGDAAQRVECVRHEWAEVISRE